jgi:hypothetical protein
LPLIFFSLPSFSSLPPQAMVAPPPPRRCEGGTELEPPLSDLRHAVAIHRKPTALASASTASALPSKIWQPPPSRRGGRAKGGRPPRVPSLSPSVGHTALFLPPRGGDETWGYDGGLVPPAPATATSAPPTPRAAGDGDRALRIFWMGNPAWGPQDTPSAYLLKKFKGSK